MNESERAKIRQAARIQQQVAQRTPGENTFLKENLTTYANGSAYFSAVSSYQAVAMDVDLRFGTGNFTVEWWQKVASTTTKPHIFSIGSLPTFMGFSLSEEIVGSNYNFHVWYNRYGSSTNINVGTYPTIDLTDRWAHVAIVRQSGNLKVYVNGTSIGNVGGFLANLNDNTANISTFTGRNVFSIGDMLNPAVAWDAQRKFYGNITNFRVTKGTAVYTANFTPATTPLTPLANTTLLVPNIRPDGENVDASKNARTIAAYSAVFSYDSPMNPICGLSQSLGCYLVGQ